MKVSDILDLQKHDLIKLPPTSLLSEAVILMAKEDIGSIVITNSDGSLKGMLTFREVIRVLAKRQEENRSGNTPTMSEIKVSEVMNATPTVTNKEMLIDVLKGLMNNCGERYLPCVENKCFFLCCKCTLHSMILHYLMFSHRCCVDQLNLQRSSLPKKRNEVFVYHSAQEDLAG